MRRREFLSASGAACAAATQGPLTEFQIACMTLPYGAFPVERAIEGIAKAGYKYMAFGSRHQGADTIAVEAPPGRARDLARRARDAGTEPVMMFGVYYIEQEAAVETYKRRIEQAAAARIPYVLAFGSPGDGPGDYAIWVRHLQQIGPLARAAGVTVVIKQRCKTWQKRVRGSAYNMPASRPDNRPGRLRSLRRLRTGRALLAL